MISPASASRLIGKSINNMELLFDRKVSLIKIPKAYGEELGIEIVGDTKVKISLVEEEDNWDLLEEKAENEIDKINTNYINEEITK